MSIINVFEGAKDSTNAMALATTVVKNAALELIALELESNTQEILDANKLDLAQAVANSVSKSLQDRLLLDEKRIQALADAVDRKSVV